MGNRVSVMDPQQINQLSEETGFTKNQIIRLYSRFQSMDRDNDGVLKREDFLRIPELVINPLGDRIVHAFFRQKNSDESDVDAHEELDEEVDFRKFVQVLAVFRPLKSNTKPVLNSNVDKLRFAFQMYDLDDDDKMTKEELLSVLRELVGEHIQEDQLQNIAQRTIEENDLDQDGVISFNEFCTALKETDVTERMSLRFLD